MAYSKNQPAWGAHLADDLERLVALHDASSIAAVIVEPVAGSTGVLVPPKGYLEKLREICTKHGILLIFDEVITGFGRLGTNFGADYFGVTPDMITCAKGLTNGAIPMGGVIVSKDIYDTFCSTAAENAIELFHGYTYSAHPVACAAGWPSLDIYKNEGLFDRVKELDALLGKRDPQPQGHRARHRSAQCRPGRRRRAGIAAGKPGARALRRLHEGL